MMWNHILALLATTTATPDTPTFFTGYVWAQQLAVAVPFVLALALVGRWMMKGWDRDRKDKDVLYERIMTDVLPALHEAATAAADLMGAAREMREERSLDRDDRIRHQERERIHREQDDNKSGGKD